jgi:hypothetical protein
MELYLHSPNTSSWRGARLKSTGGEFTFTLTQCSAVAGYQSLEFYSASASIFTLKMEAESKKLGLSLHLRETSNLASEMIMVT